MPLQSENLVRLLGGSFHEDWWLNHRTAEECLDRMLEEAPIAQQRDGAAEIARILSDEMCENQIRDLLLYEVGCVYACEDDGYDASSWLKHVLGRLLGSIANLDRHTSCGSVRGRGSSERGGYLRNGIGRCGDPATDSSAWNRALSTPTSERAQ